MPAIILGFQGVSSITVHAYVLRESLIINIVIQLIFALASEPLLFLFYGTNAYGYIKRLFRKTPHQIQPEPIKDHGSSNHTNLKLEKEYGTEITTHEPTASSYHTPGNNNSTEIKLNKVEMDVVTTPHNQIRAKDKEILLITLRCIGIGRIIGLCGSTVIHILYNSHIHPKFGSVTNALFFKDFNTNNDLPSDMGAK